MRGEAPVDRLLEPRHVEQHVDRDHDHEDDREQEDDRAHRGPLGELHRVVDVPGDLSRARIVQEVVELLLDLDPLEPMAVEPVLETVDVLLGSGEAPQARLGGEVLVHLVGGGSPLIDEDAAEQDEDADRSGEEQGVDDEDAEPTRQLQSGQIAHERVQRERDHRGGEEQEQHVPERLREHEDDEQEHGEADELDPARDADRWGLTRHGDDRTRRER